MGQVWFGTKQYMQWIPAPAVDMAAGKQGFQAQANFTNGGAWVRRSKASAKVFSLSWNLKRREEIQPVLDYADGIYGDGPFYFLNPFAADRNALPAYWAAPYMNVYDGPVVVDEKRPVILNNGTSINGYPVESAVYTLSSTSRTPSVYIPIPPDRTAHIGVHGEVLTGNASVTATPELAGSSGGTAIDLPMLSVTSAETTNVTIPGSAYSGVSISMRSANSGLMRLDGLIVQVLPTGSLPPVGGFVSGQGQSGLSFTNQPSVSEYSASLDQIGVSAEFIETEAWTWR